MCYETEAEKEHAARSEAHSLARKDKWQHRDKSMSSAVTFLTLPLRPEPAEEHRPKM